MNEYPYIQQFRIWDPEKEVFVYSGGTPMMLSSFFEQTATLHTVHIMPYHRSTFLKDKNGKENYEGDVLKLGQPFGNQIVQWEQDGYFLQAGHDRLSTHAAHMEVIGNIYENPELLAQ